MRRTQCGSCGLSDTLEVFLDLGLSPLADRFPKTFSEHEDKYRLDVAVCRNCWLVQLMEVVPDHILWSDYEFYSSGSPSLVEYHNLYAKWISYNYHDKASKFVVEIASNDGSLLQHLKKVGYKTLGIDPAEGPSEKARERGLDSITASFNQFTAATIREQYGPAGLIIANNVTAHVEDFGDFLDGIYNLLNDDGVAIIEVQAFEDLWLGNQFDHFYHEHRYYFSLQSLTAALWRHGLEVGDAYRIPMQGGSHRVVVRRSEKNDNEAEVGWLGNLALYQTMQRRADALSGRLRELLTQEREAGHSLAGYGASAKSTTLLNFCGIDFRDLEYVVDMTPSKIGRLTPGTHIPIVAPEVRPEPDTYLLLVWNYLSGVMRREHSFLANGGRFLVPIPMPVLL